MHTLRISHTGLALMARKTRVGHLLILACIIIVASRWIRWSGEELQREDITKPSGRDDVVVGDDVRSRVPDEDVNQVIAADSNRELLSNVTTEEPASWLHDVPRSFLDRGCGQLFCVTAEKDAQLLVDTTRLTLPPTSQLRQLFRDPYSEFTSEAGNFQRYMANASVSEQLLFSRDDRNYTPPYCKPVEQPHQLPSVSIVIPFHNEMWSMLLRTTHSILTTTPPSLLEEMILVDDCSTSANLQESLRTYLANIPKIKLFRTKVRQGLIRARMLGAKEATGKVLIFIDAHVVCHPGWLEPLLKVILDEPKTITTPVIHSLSPHTITTTPSRGELQYGGFTWELDFTWLLTTNRNSTDDTPIPTLTVSGSVIAVSRYYFFKLGGFDEEMNIWGGENLELPIKTWMCGGAVKVVPCSVVSHLFRTNLPYVFSRDVILKNLQRVALTWMGNMARFYFMTTGKIIPMSAEDVLSIHNRQALAKQLKCNSFIWFLETLDVRGLLPIIPSRLAGQLKCLGIERCLTATKHQQNVTLTMDTCSVPSNYQVFHYQKMGSLVHDLSDLCLAPVASPPSVTRRRVMLHPCKPGNDTQRWTFDPIVPKEYSRLLQGVDTLRPVGRFRLHEGDFNDCLTQDYFRGSHGLFLHPCVDNTIPQYWVFTHSVHSDYQLLSLVDDYMDEFN